MSKKYLFIFIIIVLIMGGFCLMKILGKEKVNEEDLDISNVKSFYITYTNGYAMNSYTRYELSKEGDVYKAIIKPYGEKEEDLLEIEVDKKIMDEIVEILKKYEVEKWDGFDKNDQGVLDGDSFSFSLGLENHKSIHASGYMMWPKNYRNVVEEISPIFMNIYNKEKGIKEDE